MAERDFSEIAKLSERYNKDPKSRIFVQLADAYRKNNMIDEALEVLNRGLEYHPHYALAHLILGKCYLDKRMYVQAEESFKKTLSIDSQNLVAYRMLAQTCELTKNEEGQIAAYKGILAIDPLDTVTKEKLDHLASRQQRQPLYTVSMAQEYENQGDMVKALSIYEQLLFTDPSDLLLQQKVKVLKERLMKEQKAEQEEEKTEESAVDTYYTLDDLMQGAEPTPPEASEVFPEPEPQPPKPDQSESLPETPIVSPVEKEEPEQKEEQVLPLEEFLIETAERHEEPAVVQDAETAPEESIATPEEAIVEPPQRLETPEQPSPEVEEEKEEPSPEPLEIETAAFHEPPEQPEEPLVEEPTESSAELKEETSTLPEVEKAEERPESVEKPVSPEAEKSEEKKEPAKPKEEDFKSFKDWLSGLLK